MLGAGTTIGAYRVLHKLGEGGMGAVYVGEHTLLGRKAAIKVLLPALSANTEILQRFFNEARALTRIADPGIVQVFDFGQDASGNAFIVMELLEGEPIDRRLERLGRFSLIDGLRLLRMICSSLCIAHARGIVHRDLKPENLFIVGDPAVTGGERTKILDFGIAKLSHNEPGALKTRTGMMMGTPMYMSPEQCRGAGDIDHRSDIYSIGCVMVAMLTGRPPFEGEASGDLIVAHLREPAPLIASRVRGTPAVIDQIAQRCLAKSAADRFASMPELVAALDAADATLDRLAGTSHHRIVATPASRIPTGATALSRIPITTLGGAAGHSVAGPPARSRGGIAALVLAATVIVGAATSGIAYVATRDRHAAGAAVPPLPPAPPPASASVAPPPAAVQAVPAAIPVDAAIDAGAPDVAIPDAIAPAAGPPPGSRPHRATSPRRAADHASATAPASPVPVDRGD